MSEMVEIILLTIPVIFLTVHDCSLSVDFM